MQKKPLLENSKEKLATEPLKTNWYLFNKQLLENNKITLSQKEINLYVTKESLEKIEFYMWNLMRLLL